MSVNLITVFLSISILFCVQEHNIRYTTDYNDSENLINVSTDVEYSGLTEKFNQQYFISPSFLAENGIVPFTTYYMTQEEKGYSANIEILESYVIENIDIELGNFSFICLAPSTSISSNTINPSFIFLLTEDKGVP